MDHRRRQDEAVDEVEKTGPPPGGPKPTLLVLRQNNTTHQAIALVDAGGHVYALDAWYDSASARWAACIKAP